MVFRSAAVSIFHPSISIAIEQNHNVASHMAGLRHPNGLDDLEDGRTADDKQEKGQQPRSDGVLVFLGFLFGLRE